MDGVKTNDLLAFFKDRPEQASIEVQVPIQTLSYYWASQDQASKGKIFEILEKKAKVIEPD